MGLRDRVAIVTGASRGIGRAIAVALGQEGARLVLVARHESGLRDVIAELAGLEAVPVCVDLRDPGAPKSIVRRAHDHFGRVDILVNNTGASLGGGLDSTSRDDLAESFTVNVEVPFALSREAIPYMKAAGYGRIILLSSIYGRESGGKIPYNAAKAAEISLSKALAREVAASGVTVNNVAPGSIRYPGGSWDKRVLADPQSMDEFVGRELPLGRFGTAAEVASVVTFLCSPLASLVNGASVVVDGGQGRSNL